MNGYLRHHQVSEAEVVIVSKSDLVSPEQLDIVRSAIEGINPSMRTVVYSSINGEGFSEVIDLVTGRQVSDRRPTDIDYGRYAEAEAELGWYNSTISVDLAPRTDVFDLGKRFLASLSELYPAGDVAHAKVILTTSNTAMKMSCVQGRLGVDMAKGSRFAEGKGRSTVNARVVSSPEDLRRNVRAALAKVFPGELAIETEECFSPSPPKPFHRMKE